MSRTRPYAKHSGPVLFAQYHGELVPAEEAPGIYVEQAGPGETSLAPLSGGEMALVLAVGKAADWTRTGFEVGREHGCVNIKADYRDALSGFLDFGTWRLAPAAGLVRWAVEFPVRGRYVRRAFWFASRHQVPGSA